MRNRKIFLNENAYLLQSRNSTQKALQELASFVRDNYDSSVLNLKAKTGKLKKKHFTSNFFLLLSRFNRFLITDQHILKKEKEEYLHHIKSKKAC